MKITKENTIGEVLEKYPKAAEFLMEKGFHCLGCAMAASETLEEGFKAHGYSDEEVEKVIKEMNELVEKS